MGMCREPRTINLRAAGLLMHARCRFWRFTARRRACALSARLRTSRAQPHTMPFRPARGRLSLSSSAPRRAETPAAPACAAPRGQRSQWPGGGEEGGRRVVVGRCGLPARRRRDIPRRPPDPHARPRRLPPARLRRRRWCRGGFLVVAARGRLRGPGSLGRAGLGRRAERPPHRQPQSRSQDEERERSGVAAHGHSCTRPRTPLTGGSSSELSYHAT
jgi:hypothetical protein